MSSPDKSISWTKFITGFIDDNRQYSNDWINNDTSNVLNKIKKNSVQEWEHLLHTSGGSLELSKCALYLISWNFNDDGTHYINSSTNVSLHIISSSIGKKIEIKVLTNEIPFTYLGITSSPNGKQKNELQSLIKRLKIELEYFNHSHLRDISLIYTLTRICI